jgi:hypothetical protein
MPTPPPDAPIPPYRKVLYYGGFVVILAGFAVFLSNFFRIPHLGDGFERGMGSMMGRAFLGMGLIVAGGVMRKIGARGLAGSGIVLDPHQARRDIEPWSRMAGGVAKDALEETGLLDQGKDASAAPGAHVKVRCKACRALNEEDARFCKQCGAAV